MRVPSESLGVVESALHDYLSRPVFGDRDFAKRFRALPLYAGWEGTTYLTTSGEFWYLNHDIEPPRIETDISVRAKIVALVMASKRHPQLAMLLPNRPDSASDCPQCAGRGEITVGPDFDIVCGHCSGLGWHAKSDHVDTDRYPPFEEAIAQLRTFASQHGMHGDVRFITPEDALFWRGRLYVSASPTEHALQKAHERYELAVGRRLGVVVGVSGELPGGSMAAYVFGPATELEAEQLMFPSGLKLSLPSAHVSIRVVAAPRLKIMRWIGGKRTVRRTHELFK